MQPEQWDDRRGSVLAGVLPTLLAETRVSKIVLGNARRGVERQVAKDGRLPRFHSGGDHQVCSPHKVSIRNCISLNNVCAIICDWNVRKTGFFVQAQHSSMPNRCF